MERPAKGKAVRAPRPAARLRSTKNDAMFRCSPTGSTGGILHYGPKPEPGGRISASWISITLGILKTHAPSGAPPVPSAGWATSLAERHRRRDDQPRRARRLGGHRPPRGPPAGPA